jgi:hypothetical protein
MHIMKRTGILIAALLSALLMMDAVPSSAQDNTAAPFLGMWALSLDYSDNNAGWIEVRQQDGYLDASILWRWGSVYNAGFVFVMDGELFLTNTQELVRGKDAEGKPVKTQQQVNWLQLRKDGDDVVTGFSITPNSNGIGVDVVSFTGKRIPPAGEAPDLTQVKYGKEIELFNGKDLEGWELTDPNATNGWKVVDGVLVTDPVQPKTGKHITYGNLRTKQEFEDFNLTLEVNVPAESNSGVYLRGIYEVQVFDSFGKELDPHNMGALYSRITPSVAAEKPAGQWQKLDITLCKRHLTVVLNGTTIIDNQPIKGVTGGALTADEFSPGPIYLQGDHGKVSYRNIVLKPIME